MLENALNATNILPESLKPSNGDTKNDPWSESSVMTFLQQKLITLYIENVLPYIKFVVSAVIHIRYKGLFVLDIYLLQTIFFIFSEINFNMLS